MIAQPPATPRDGRTERQSPELTTLRRLGVWIPVGGIGLLVGLLPILSPEWGWRGALIPYLITMGIVTAGAYLFSRFVFRIVQQKENEILRHNRELAVLNTVGAVLNQSLDLDSVLNRSLAKVLEVTGADAGEVLLWDDRREELVQIAFQGIFPQAFREITRFKRGEGLPGIVAEEDRTIVMEDVADDPRFLRKQVSSAGFHSFAGVVLTQYSIRPRFRGPQPCRGLVSQGIHASNENESVKLERTGPVASCGRQGNPRVEGG